jgi:hypothetical protein
VRQIKDREIPNPNDLEEFIREASEVKQLTQMTGWGILERDLTLYKDEIGKKIAYLHPSRPEFNEARILYLAADKLISLVNDYQENRDIAIDLLNKINNPDLAVTMDVDGE